MIEIKLLKTSHSNEAEARKLLPFVRECSVFSPESAFMRDESAKKAELNWRKYLDSGMSRTKFHETMSRSYNTNAHTGIAQYAKKMWDYAYTLRKPVIYLERFEGDISKQLEEEWRRGSKLIDSGYRLILSGGEEGGIRQYVEDRKIVNDITSKRDKNMAYNITNVEDLILAVYPELNSKPLKLFASVGNMHTPENFCESTIEVVDLTAPLHMRQAELLHMTNDLVECSDVDYDKLLPMVKELAEISLGRNFKIRKV